MYITTQVTQTALDLFELTLSSIALELYSIIETLEKINSSLQNIIDISFNSFQSETSDSTSTITSFGICYDRTLKTFYFKIHCTNKHIDINKEPSILKRPCSKPLPGLPCFCKHFLSGCPPLEPYCSFN